MSTSKETLSDGIERKVYIRTFGCQMNVADSAAMMNLLKAAGYVAAVGAADADVVIFNSCSVRQHAEDRMFSNLGLAMKKNPSAKFILAGCTAKRAGESVFERFPKLDAVIGPSQISAVSSVVSDVLEGRRPEPPGDIGYPVIERDGGVSEYVVIQTGCDNYCSYCVVPYLRGDEASRPPDEILREISCLAANGTKEVILLGQNVNSYSGAGKIRDFPELLSAVSGIEGIDRIRFLTSHPKDLSDKLIKEFAENKKLAHHLHLPVQSGSDRILKLMNRNYTRKHYLGLIKKLRRADPDIAVTTDVICGFPSETEEDFSDTLSLIEEAGFEGVFVFKYSERSGTAAAKLDDDVTEAVKKERLSRALAAAKRISKKAREKMKGAEAEVLFEKDGVGHSTQNFLVLKEGARAGEFKKLKIKGTRKWSLLA